MIQQIAVGAMDLDAIEAGILSILSADAVAFDDLGNFVQLQRSRRDIILLRPEYVDMALWGNRLGATGDFPCSRPGRKFSLRARVAAPFVPLPNERLL